MIRIFYFLVFLLVFNSVSAVAQHKTSVELTPDAQISILTCGTGAELYALYGHTAIRVWDPMSGIDRVYNYGMFDFDTSNFYLKFVKGDLLYFVDYTSYEHFLQSYIYDNRSVYEQVLNLNSAQKQLVWEGLLQSMEPDEKFYVYKFIDQNCTTKVVGLLNAALAKPLDVEIAGNDVKYRTILNTYLTKNYFEKLGINLIFGSKVDRVSNLLFLPDKFMQSLELSTENGQPVISETKVIYEAQNIPEGAWWNTWWFFSLLMVVLLISLRKNGVRKAFFGLLGILGIFFIWVGYYSDHQELINNNTVFLCNPLFVLILFWKSKRSAKYKVFLNVMLAFLLLFVVLNAGSEKLIVSLPLLLSVVIAVFLEKKYRTLPSE